MTIISFAYKAFKTIISKIKNPFAKFATKISFLGNEVQHKHFRTSGTPYVNVAIGGKFSIGNNFAMNNGIKGNPIGCYNKCTLIVDNNAELIIGENVGISQTAIICHHKITIGNDVKIGGGVCIYDTDFHSLDPNIRKSKDDIKHKVKKPVAIGDNVFIGAQSLILKGVTIGENSIIGAGSVVAKSIPANQIWAGNPARFIKEIN